MKRWRVPKYRRGVGVVFRISPFKDRNVYENVAFAQRVIEKPNRVIKSVPEVLTLVGLAVYKSFPKELSERAAASCRGKSHCQPADILADEPTETWTSSMEIMAPGGNQQQRNDRSCGNPQP